jgi:predicted HTH domain antitoxin
LQEKRIVGLQSVSESIEKELLIFLKIMVLLYADDRVILSESAEDLQLALNEFFIYCTQ